MISPNGGINDLWPKSLHDLSKLQNEGGLLGFNNRTFIWISLGGYHQTQNSTIPSFGAIGQIYSALGESGAHDIP